MDRLIIDVTQLAKWQGKLTGIPRVMDEVFRRYNTPQSNVIFVEWNSVSHSLEEITAKDVRGRRDSALSAVNIGSVEQKSSKRVLKKIYHMSPSPIKKIARRLKQSTSQVGVSTSDFVFQKTDKLLVLWGEWSDEAYRQKLEIILSNHSIRLYQLVYDMLPLVTPQYSSHSTEGLGHYARDIYPKAEKLISISEYTRKDLQKWLGDQKCRVPQIEVIRLGEDFEKETPEKPQSSFFEDSRQYILCVGTIESRKNHALLYYTYKLAKARSISLPPLVIVGRRGWLSENIYELMTTDPETKDSFIFLHDASDEELSWLYGHALFSIYPSQYEGWGLPISESIIHGTPVTSSNTSSMPEIAGDLITYFSPNSTDECLEAIQYLMSEENLKVAKKKIEAYHSTSWDETFEQLKGIIESSNDK